MAKGVRAESGDGSVRGEGASEDGSVRGKGAQSDPTKGPGSVTVSSNRPGNAPSTVYMGQATPPNVPFAVSPRPVVVDIDQAESAYTSPDAYNRFMTKEWKDWTEGLAKFIDYRRTGSSLWTDAINASQALEKQGVKVSPMRWLIDVAKEKGYTLGQGPSAGEQQSRGLTASRRISRTSERDLKLTADAIASEILGRAVTDEEFNKVLSKVRAAEVSDAPTGGLSAAGQQDLIRDELMMSPDSEEFGRATKMMDLFYSALESRPRGA